MKVLILGSGGREHALAVKMIESSSVERVYVMPGNDGMKLDPNLEIIPQSIEAQENVLAVAADFRVDLIIVGPEGPLASGLVDYLEKNGMSVLGPSKLAAQLESSKIFSKEFMQRHEIPTASFNSFSNYADALAGLENWDFEDGIVIKADTLAAGKGVVLCDTIEEAKKVVHDFMVNEECTVKTEQILFEKKLHGKEVSAFALCDGTGFFELGYVCDYKRAGDGDTGPNTGGMGCYTPTNWPTKNSKKKITNDIFMKVIDGMKKEKMPFKGILFAGLMIDGEDVNVIEFNVRFGDPETQTLLPLLEGDLAKAFQYASAGEIFRLSEDFLKKNEKVAVHVVMASGGYPKTDRSAMELGNKIVGNSKKFRKGDYLFYAGVKNNPKGELSNSGGRVLGVTAVADTVGEARKWAYSQLGYLKFDKGYWRKDIAKLD